MVKHSQENIHVNDLEKADFNKYAECKIERDISEKSLKVN